MKAPETVETARLVLRKPAIADAESIYSIYASDPEVTRFLGWPRHESIHDTLAFLRFAENEWRRWPADAYLIELRDTGHLIGSSGFNFAAPRSASTGYVLAKPAWGHGYATEALHAIAELAPGLGLQRLFALCHPEHAASYRVLEKCGFVRVDAARRRAEFPNLRPGELVDVLSYVRVFE